MTNITDKKELITQYKQRKVVGGIYAIKNNQNGKMFIDGTTDIKGMQNRFSFSQKTGSCVNTKIHNDWSSYGCSSFSFEILDELAKKEEQTISEFREEIDLLKEIWLDKHPNENLY